MSLVPALATAFAVYWLYERTDHNTIPLSEEHEEVAEQLKTDLHQLVQHYYERYIYPHEYPLYSLIIPASRSETRGKQQIHVLINNPTTGTLFPYNTLLQAGAHECAHMLCRVEESDPHGPIFIEVLQRLDKLGMELKLYDPTMEIPAEYKQYCH